MARVVPSSTIVPLESRIAGFYPGVSGFQIREDLRIVWKARDILIKGSLDIGA
jgi:hypothetical protein